MPKNLKTELAHEWPVGKVCLTDLCIICTVAKQVVQINMVKERLAGGKQHTVADISIAHIPFLEQFHSMLHFYLSTHNVSTLLNACISEVPNVECSRQ